MYRQRHSRVRGVMTTLLGRLGRDPEGRSMRVHKGRPKARCMTKMVTRKLSGAKRGGGAQTEEQAGDVKVAADAC